MKKLIPALLCTVVVAATALCGCSNTKHSKFIYTVFTSCPSALTSVSASYSVDDKTLTAVPAEGGVIGVADSADYSGYTRAVFDYPFVMHTDAHLEVYGQFSNDEEEANAQKSALYNAVGTELWAIHDALAVNQPTSDIARFNSAAAGEKIEISALAYECLTLAKQMYTFTDGYYNPAVYYSVQAFGFDGSYNFPKTKNDLPSTADTDKYAELASHFGEVVLEKVAADDGQESYYVTKPSFTVEVGDETLALKVDLGGIGKGYAADKVNAILQEMGYKCGYFNFGASSLFFLTNPKSSDGDGAYKLGFVDPRNSSSTYAQVKISNIAISSSGDYENYYLINNVRYCHIMNPYTGRPVNTGIMAVTIMGGSAAEDDALTTAIMAMGYDKAISFINTYLADKYVIFTFEDMVDYVD